MVEEKIKVTIRKYPEIFILMLIRGIDNHEFEQTIEKNRNSWRYDFGMIGEVDSLLNQVEFRLDEYRDNESEGRPND